MTIIFTFGWTIPLTATNLFWPHRNLGEMCIKHTPTLQQQEMTEVKSEARPFTWEEILRKDDGGMNTREVKMGQCRERWRKWNRGLLTRLLREPQDICTVRCWTNRYRHTVALWGESRDTQRGYQGQEGANTNQTIKSQAGQLTFTLNYTGAHEDLKEKLEKRRSKQHKNR